MESNLAKIEGSWKQTVRKSVGAPSSRNRLQASVRKSAPVSFWKTEASVRKSAPVGIRKSETAVRKSALLSISRTEASARKSAPVAVPKSAPIGQSGGSNIEEGSLGRVPIVS